MSKPSSEVICLNEQQIETNIKNIANCMKLTGKLIKRFSGSLKISKEEATKLDISFISQNDRPEAYHLYEIEDEFYFLVISSHKFGVNQFIGCDYFDHLIKPFAKENNLDRPKVYIMIAYTIKDTEFDRIPTNLLKCPYRLVRLTKLHPITGSSNGIEGFATEYELLKYEKPISFNNKKYPYIFDYDPGSIIVNALPGELVRAKLFYNDKGCVYTEYKIREVLRSKTRLGQFDNSGLDNFEY